MIDNPEAVTDIIAVSGNDDADCTRDPFYVWAAASVGGAEGRTSCCSSAECLFDQVSCSSLISMRIGVLLKCHIV